MEFGVFNYLVDYGISPTVLARAVEDRGFESFWVGDHTHIPAMDSNAPDYAMFVECYSRMLDPFVALTAAACATECIKLATGVILIAEREPIALANATASLNFISGGRLIFGVSPGWNMDELRNHGINAADRFAVTRERVLAIREIWANDVAEYHGDFVDFTPLMSWPKPDPVIPIVIGGNGATVLDRCFDYCDGWLPLVLGPAENILALEPRVREFRERAAASGREFSLSVLSQQHTEEHVAAMVELGCDRGLFITPPGPEDEIIRLVDEIAEVTSAAV
jgi:probable F420-dependent oxidoreductase